MASARPAVAPLAGLRVLDLTRLFPFSYGTQFLVDLGAEVIKVEEPGGEVGRAYAGQYRAANRGKRSLTVDLRQDGGRADLLELVASADAVVESFRPGYLDRLGVGYDVLGAVRPDLVLCSVTGYAPGSPLAERPGHDLNYYAIAGAALADGDADPAIPALPVVDLAAGLALAYSLAAWLLGVARGGPGGHVQLSMADLALSLTTSSLAFVAAPPAERAAPYPGFVLGQVPCYRAWPTADGRWITLCNLEPKFWRTFLDLVGAPDLIGDQLAEGERGEAAIRRLGDLLLTRPASEWEALFTGREVCFAVARTPEEARADADAIGRGLLREIDGAPEVLFPGTVDGVRPPRPSSLAAPGEDNHMLPARVARSQGDP